MYAVFPRFTVARLESMMKEEAKKPPIEIPHHIQKNYNVTLLENAKCRTHVISPQNHQSTDVVVFHLHGGAYIGNFMMPAHIDAAVKIMDAIGHCIMILPEYPLVPNVTHVALFEVIEAVYRQVISIYPNHKIVISGDSAGGGAALILTQRLAAETAPPGNKNK
jgi:acetyl esterase/lipase